MDAERRQQILCKRVRVKKRKLACYAKLHVGGEPSYDFAAAIASTEKRPCIETKQG